MAPLCFNTLWQLSLLLGSTLLPFPRPRRSCSIWFPPTAQVPSLTPSWPLSRASTFFLSQVHFLLPRTSLILQSLVKYYFLTPPTMSLTPPTMSSHLPLRAFPSEHLSHLKYVDWGVCLMSQIVSSVRPGTMTVSIAWFTVPGTGWHIACSRNLMRCEILSEVFPVF